MIKICPVCKQEKDSVAERRQNTRYTDDSKNYVVMCGECFKGNEEYWKGMWEDVYNGILYYLYRERKCGESAKICTS